MTQTVKDSPRPIFKDCRKEEEMEFQGREGEFSGKGAWRIECFRKSGKVGVQIPMPLSHAPKKPRQDDDQEKASSFSEN